MDDEEHQGDHEQHPRNLRGDGRNARSAQRSRNKSHNEKQQREELMLYYALVFKSTRRAQGRPAPIWPG